MVFEAIAQDMPQDEFSAAVAKEFARSRELIAAFNEAGQEVVEGLGDGRVRWRIFDTRNAFLGSISGKLIMWKEAVELSPPGLVLEFGVRSGKTIRAIAEAKRQVFGFDWWKGLPHDEDEHWFYTSCKCEKPLHVPSNVHLIEGLFSDTLEGFLETNDGPVAFVNLDCDLFTSSFYVLHVLMDRFVNGSIIAFSAMTFGTAQRRAFDRYLKESGQRWELIGKQHWAGEIYRFSSVL